MSKIAVILGMLMLGAAVTSSPANAWTRDEATLIARDRFALAFQHVGHFIDGCLTTPGDCPLDTRQARALRLINWELRERPWSQTLQFASEAADPGFFVLDGAVRIAKTGSDRNDLIYINTDLIALPLEHPANKFRPISFDEAVGILTHEYGHHVTPPDGPRYTHEELDVLGNRLRTLMLRHSDREVITPDHWTGLAPGQELVLDHFVSLGNQGQGQEVSHLMLSGPFGVVDLSNAAKGRLRCPRIYYRGELAFEGTPGWFHLKSKSVEFAGDASDVTIMVAVRDARVICFNDLSIGFGYWSFKGYQDGVMSLPVRRNAKGISFSAAEVTWHMTVPPDIYFD